MTSTWGRAVSTLTCGGCGSLIERGQPAWSVALPGVKRARWRCIGCSGRSVPAHLPPFHRRPAIELTYFDEDGIERPIPAQAPEMTRIRPERMRQFLDRLDFKQKASGQ